MLALREARLRAGVLQEDLARRAGIERTTLSRAERGERRLSAATEARVHAAIARIEDELLSAKAEVARCERLEVRFLEGVAGRNS